MKLFSALWLAVCLLAMPVWAETSVAPMIKTDQIKSMMQRLQMVTEIYGIDHEGKYPANLFELYQQTSPNNLWIDKIYPTVNGIKQIQIQPVVFLDIPKSSGMMTAIASQPGTLPLGFIYFRAEASEHYCIFALDGQGGLLKASSGQPLLFSDNDDSKLCSLD